MKILGIDIGGTGIKGGIVDTKKGIILSERVKLGTPSPATPKLILASVKELISTLNWDSSNIGIGFPSTFRNGICLTANNIDKSWINVDSNALFSKLNTKHLNVINDADAAGLAEYTFGAAKRSKGLVIVLTLGTGIGSAFIYNGTLIPNIELGSIPWRDSIVEHYASNDVRKKQDLSWKEWAFEVNLFLNYVERIYSPSKIILGGGVSKKIDLYRGFIKLERNTPIVTAQLLNNAGIIGAAFACHLKIKAK